MTIVETTVATLVDFWPNKLQKRKPLVLGLVCLVMFLAGLPMCTGVSRLDDFSLFNYVIAFIIDL